jgi:hypothetical protein
VLLPPALVYVGGLDLPLYRRRGHNGILPTQQRGLGNGIVAWRRNCSGRRVRRT